jgi:hypothetical protein
MTQNYEPNDEEYKQAISQTLTKLRELSHDDGAVAVTMATGVLACLIGFLSQNEIHLGMGLQNATNSLINMAKSTYEHYHNEEKKGPPTEPDLANMASQNQKPV